ncbi:hypothetical protein C3V41_01815 [Actinomyces sp. oral taxon 897]|nr:hypothetical protein C3V41_01815 [Actinomyces sp. oral taxon 897]
MVLGISLVAWCTELSPGVTDRLGDPSADSVTGLPGLLGHWDTNYYFTIASQGYGADAEYGLAAFFPGYPYLSRWVAAVLPSQSTGIAMLVVASASSWWTAVVFSRLVALETGAGDELSYNELLPVVLLMAGPYSVFLYASYAESLYLALAVTAWYLARRGRWWTCAALLSLAVLVRVNAVFLVAAVLVMQACRCGLSRWWRFSWVVLPAGFLLGWFARLYSVTGDALAWSHAQGHGWNRELSLPVMTIARTLGVAAVGSTPDRQLQFLLDFIFFLVVLSCCWAWWRRREYAELMYATLLVLSMGTSTTLVSFARNSVTLFPTWVLAGDVLTRARTRVRVLVMASSFLLFTLNTFLFSIGAWTD